MSGERNTKRWAVVGVGLLVAGVVTSAVVASRFDDGSDLATAVEQAPLTRVADIPAADGAPALGVFVQQTSTGHLCVRSAPSATARQRGGGCNTIDDPLNGEAISATLSYDGGPGRARVSAATLFGLARADVASVQIVMTDGTPRVARLTPVKVAGGAFGAFGYRFRSADLRQGLGPTAVVALDAAGVEIGRQPTGFAG